MATWRAEFKKFTAVKVDFLAMLLLGGPPLQPPARGGRRSKDAGADRGLQEGGHVSDGDASGYSSSGAEDVEAPASMGTRNADMSWQTTTRACGQGKKERHGGRWLIGEGSSGSREEARRYRQWAGGTAGGRWRRRWGGRSDGSSGAGFRPTSDRWWGRGWWCRWRWTGRAARDLWRRRVLAERQRREIS